MVNLSKFVSLGKTVAPFLLVIGWISGNIFSLKIADTIIVRPIDLVVFFVWLIAVSTGGVRAKIQLPVYFFIVAGVSLLIGAQQLNKNEFLTAFAYLYRWAVYAFCAYALSLVIKHHKIQLLLIILPTITAITGILQYLFLPDVRFLYYSGWDDHYYRIISQLLDPGFTSIVLVIGFLFILCANLAGRPVYKITAAVLFISLLFTYSRSGYLSLLSGLIILGWQSKKIGRSFILIALLALGIFLLPRPAGEGVRLERTASTTARFVSWANSISIIKENLIFGVGFNAYRYAQRDRNFLDMSNWQSNHAGAGVDSSLLFVLSTTGLVGFAAFGYWIHLLWKRSGIFRPILFAMLVHSLFLNSLFYPFVLLLLGLLIAYIHKKPPQGE